MTDTPPRMSLSADDALLPMARIPDTFIDDRASPARTCDDDARAAARVAVR
ncbi:MAG TPA: hypothetical protein VIG88_00130 [Lysobacter sp.]